MTKPTEKMTPDPKQATWRALLQSIIADRARAGESLADVGRVLAEIVQPARRPLSRQYVNALAAGRDRITEPLGRAIETLAAMQDGVATIQATARPVTVPILSTHDLPEYTIIVDPPKRCALPGCRITFVGRRLYCGPDCKAEAAKRRKAAARQAG